MNYINSKQIFALTTDPIYIGTGGYTIGRVDNTIVRDPITKIPKIPGSSLAGTWRYYVALDIHKYFTTDEYKTNRSSRQGKDLQTIFVGDAPGWIINFEGNKYIAIKCAGQDETPNEEDNEKNTGHCGHCIVCKAFGYSKKSKSWQGMLFFSDLNILFFPVYTRLGTKWITSPKLLSEALNINVNVSKEKIKTNNSNEKILNLGWLNLEVENKHNINDSQLTNEIKTYLKPEDIVLVSDSLISQIINSNLEVRTSVSIDPITGAAKEGALFTSEAIPRGTVFYGEIRIFDKNQFGDNNLPSKEFILEALDDTKEYYETLGIGGMTTRGFGRMKVSLADSTNGTNAKTGGDNHGN